MIHGDNERISLENLEFGYKVLKKTIRDFIWKDQPQPADQPI